MSVKNIFTVIISLAVATVAQGQNETEGNKYLSLGTKTEGICFGNSENYNGLRFNLWDDYTDRINGFNFSFSIDNYYANGLQIGGLVASSKQFNGLSISGFLLYGRKINGIGISGFAINCDTLNGIFIALGVAARSIDEPNKVLNGIGVSVFVVGAEKVRGIAIAGFMSYSKKQYGLSIAAHNQTDELHGLQIGLINYAGNNPKLLRWLPLLNFHP